MTSTTDLLAHGRRYLLSKAPYLRRLVTRTTTVPDERVPTMGVSDKMILVYNPNYLEGKTHRQVGALLLHEMMHLAHTVIQAHDLPHVPHELMNMAADLHINSLARADGWELPTDGLFPEKFGFPESLTTLEYLELLQKNPPKPPPRPSPVPGNGSGGEKGAEEGDGGKGEQEGNAGGTTEEGTSQKPEKPSGCCQGRCKLQGELKEEMEARYGRGQEDLHQTVKAVARESRAHSKQAGSTSLGKTFFGDFGDVEESDTDWQSVLRSWVLGYLGVGDNRTLPSYAKPHRRSFLGGDILVPGSYSETPDMVVVVDTSGSMNAQLLSQCMAELAGILSSLNLEDVELICADTKICSRKRVSFEDLYLPIELAGGGGTDFAFPIRQVADSGGCGVLVYLTDGHGHFPKQMPPFPVVWACFTDAPFPPHQAVVRIKS